MDLCQTNVPFAKMRIKPFHQIAPVQHPRHFERRGRLPYETCFSNASTENGNVKNKVKRFAAAFRWHVLVKREHIPTVMHVPPISKLIDLHVCCTSWTTSHPIDHHVRSSADDPWLFQRSNLETLLSKLSTAWSQPRHWRWHCLYLATFSVFHLFERPWLTLVVCSSRWNIMNWVLGLCESSSMLRKKEHKTLDQKRNLVRFCRFVFRMALSDKQSEFEQSVRQRDQLRCASFSVLVTKWKKDTKKEWARLRSVCPEKPSRNNVMK